MIADELLELADKILAGWDKYEVALDQPEKNYIAKVVKAEDTADGIPFTVMKWRCEGLTMEQWDVFISDPSLVSV